MDALPLPIGCKIGFIPPGRAGRGPTDSRFPKIECLSPTTSPRPCASKCCVCPYTVCYSRCPALQHLAQVWVGMPGGGGGRASQLQNWVLLGQSVDSNAIGSGAVSSDADLKADLR